MNKLISVNYWFGCDWWFCEVGYLGLHAGQLSLTCAVVYLWNTGYIRVTRPRMETGIQYNNNNKTKSEECVDSDSTDDDDGK